jgi:hypothetical protein
MIEHAMTSGPRFAWVCTVLFGLPSGFLLYRLASGRVWTERVGNGFHLLAALTMISMLWPWGAHIPAIIQAFAFCAGAGWFAIAASKAIRATEVGIPNSKDALTAAYHSAMMVSMVWMVLRMTDHSVDVSLTPIGPTYAGSPEIPSSKSPLSIHGSHGSAATSSVSIPQAHQDWTSTVSVALVLAFAAAALVWLYRTVEVDDMAYMPLPLDQSDSVVGSRRPRLSPTAAMECCTAAGMSVMTALLL